MRRALALAVLACVLAPAVEAAPRWTFCVAASASGDDVWISDVFAADGARERFEAAFQAAAARLGASGAVAQCPQPREDKTVAINAQIDAEAFNRKMGAAMHAVSARDFPGRR